MTWCLLYPFDRAERAEEADTARELAKRPFPHSKYQASRRSSASRADASLATRLEEERARSVTENVLSNIYVIARLSFALGRSLRDLIQAHPVIFSILFALTDRTGVLQT